MNNFILNQTINEFISEASKFSKYTPLEYISFIQDFLESKGKTIRETIRQEWNRELPVIQKNTPRGGYFVILCADDESTLLQQMFLVMIILLSGESVLENYCQKTQEGDCSLNMYLNAYPTISHFYHRLVTIFKVNVIR